jgi:membrane-bound serine protease (ClpP class)
VAGAAALVGALYGMSILPVNWAGLLFLVLGLALLVLEVKVTSYGALAIAGVAAMAFGSLMLFDGPIPALRVGLGVVLPTVVVVAVVVMGLVSAVLGSLREQAQTGREGMVGLEGEALTELAPAGQVFVHGEIWQAVATRPVPVRSRVRVVAIKDLTLEVEPAGTAPPGAGG